MRHIEPRPVEEYEENIGKPYPADAEKSCPVGYFSGGFCAGIIFITVLQWWLS